MCGIAGFSRSTEVTRFMMPFMAWDIERRGRDSWGATDGLTTIKSLGKITETWGRGINDLAPEGGGIILHTRHASTGAVTVENQHPWTFEKIDQNNDNIGSIIGVHNGCLSNHTALNTKHNRAFEVDSMHIFANIAEGKPTEELTGWGACVWMDVTEQAASRVIRLARFNMTDFHVFLLETGEIVFCSFEEVVEKAAKMAGSRVKTKFKLVDGESYYIAPGENNMDVFWRGPDMKFGNRWTQPATVTYYPKGTSSSLSSFSKLIGPPDDEIEPWYGRSGGRSGDAEKRFLAWEKEQRERLQEIEEPTKTRKTSSDAPKTVSSTKKPCLSLIGSHGRSKDLCAKCLTGKVDRGAKVFCTNCMERFFKDVYKPTDRHVATMAKSYAFQKWGDRT